MKKSYVCGLSFLVIAGLLCGSLAAAGLAAESPKKVVKIQPAKIETAPAPRQKVEPVKPVAIEELPPQPAPVVEAAPEPTQKLYGPYIGLSGGVAQPGYAVGLGLGTTLFTIADKTDINVRLGVGYAAGNSIKAWIGGADVSLVFRQLATASFPLALGIGGGIVYPFSVNDNRTGEMGYEAFGGAYYGLTDNLELGLEVGYIDFKVKENNVSRSSKGVLARAGLKWYF